MEKLEKEDITIYQPNKLGYVEIEMFDDYCRPISKMVHIDELEEWLKQCRKEMNERE